MQTLARLRNEAQQGMITLLTFLLGVIPSLRSLLKTGSSNYRRIHIHSDPGKPLLRPDPFPRLHLTQLMTMTKIETLKQLAKGTRIGKQLPAKQLSNSHVCLQNSQMAQVLRSCQNAHHEYHDHIGYRIIRSNTSLDGQSPIQSPLPGRPILSANFPRLTSPAFLVRFFPV